MAVRKLAPEEFQPKSFAFTPENQAFADQEIAKYPPGRQASAIIAVLGKAQQQNGGWLPLKAIEAVAEKLGMPAIRVMEVATFYTMFNLEPVGKHFIQLCGTTPCGLRGAGEIRKILERRVGEQNRVSPDGVFSWLEVECLGACCNAPMVQINDVYYEDLTPANFEQLLDDLQAERPVRKGSQVGRNTSEPQGAVNTLTDPTLFDGSVVGSWRKRFEEAAVQTGEDAAAEASMPEKSKVGRPLVGRPNETEAVDTPAERAKRGETPISPAAEKAASDPTRATAVEARQEDASESAPQSTKSYVATPSNPGKDRPVASQPTTPQAGTPPSEATTRRDGSESKQDVIVDHKDVKRPD